VDWIKWKDVEGKRIENYMPISIREGFLLLFFVFVGLLSFLLNEGYTSLHVQSYIINSAA